MHHHIQQFFYIPIHKNRNICTGACNASQWYHANLELPRRFWNSYFNVSIKMRQLYLGLLWLFICL